MLPFLLSLGLPALAPSIGITGLSGAALAGLGAGLGSFFETGDVGKGIKTGMLSFLGGKILGGLGGGVAGLKDSASANALLSGSAQASMAQPQFIEAVKTAGTNVPFANFLGEGAATGILQPGVMTAATIGSAVGAAQNVKDQKKDDDNFEAPMPNPPKKVVSFGDPLESSKEQNYFDYLFYPDEDLGYPYVDYAASKRKSKKDDSVRTMRGGGLMGLGQQYSHPMFNMMETHLNTSLQQASSQKVKPFIQEVETMAKERFGPDIFQGQLLPTKGPFDVANLVPLTDSGIALPSIGSNANPMETYTRPLPGSNFHLFAQPLEQILRSNAAFEGGEVAQLQAAGSSPLPLSLSSNVFRSALGYAEGGEVEGMNEKEVILEAIMAIKGLKEESEAQMILGKFLATYGEEALRDLVSSVQSGEFDETVERFAEGEKGIVRGPGDGSGEDDKVPATLDNQQDVLLTEGEYVFREPTTDALTKAYGGGFLDKINQAEERAPEVLKEMVG
jgi:hypothetical protein